MKMTKKFLIGAVLAAAVLSISCQKEIGDINWKGGVVGSGDGTTTFTVKQTNDADGTIRGMKQVGVLDRAQGTCVVRQFNQSSKTSDGMVGFVCCFTKNKTPVGAEEKAENDGTYNFLVVGVRNHLGITETYASFFYNIAEKNLSTKNFGTKNVIKEAYDPAETKPYEVEILKFPKTLSGVTFDKNGTLTVAIKLSIENDKDVKITWLKDVTENEQAAQTSGGTLLLEVTASARRIGTDLVTKKGKICTYANIYEGKTLNARWDIYDVSWSTEEGLFADDDFIDVGDIFFEEM